MGKARGLVAVLHVCVQMRHIMLACVWGAGGRRKRKAKERRKEGEEEERLRSSVLGIQ